MSGCVVERRGLVWTGPWDAQLHHLAALGRPVAPPRSPGTARCTTSQPVSASAPRVALLRGCKGATHLRHASCYAIAKERRTSKPGASQE
eukprot:71978-Chlamydomonas_euryale.AAC.2